MYLRSTTVALSLRVTVHAAYPVPQHHLVARVMMGTGSGIMLYRNTYLGISLADAPGRVMVQHRWYTSEHARVLPGSMHASDPGTTLGIALM